MLLFFGRFGLFVSFQSLKNFQFRPGRSGLFKNYRQNHHERRQKNGDDNFKNEKNVSMLKFKKTQPN